MERQNSSHPNEPDGILDRMLPEIDTEQFTQTVSGSEIIDMLGLKATSFDEEILVIPTYPQNGVSEDGSGLSAIKGLPRKVRLTKKQGESFGVIHLNNHQVIPWKIWEFKLTELQLAILEGRAVRIAEQVADGVREIIEIPQRPPKKPSLRPKSVFSTPAAAFAAHPEWV